MSTPPRRLSLARLGIVPAAASGRPRLVAAVRSPAARQVLSFSIVGAVSTAAYVVLYAFLRSGMPAAEANAIALIATTIGNTAANRRLTFAVRGRNGMARDQLVGLAALGVALAVTSASIAVLQATAPHASRLVELAVLVSANALATLVRFLLLRTLIGRGLATAPSSAGAREPVPVALSTEER